MTMSEKPPLERYETKWYCDATFRLIRPSICSYMECDGNHYRLWKEKSPTDLPPKADH